MTGMSVPVLDHRGGLDAVMTLIGVTGSFDMRTDGAIATELRHAVEAASRG